MDAVEASIRPQFGEVVAINPQELTRNALFGSVESVLAESGQEELKRYPLGVHSGGRTGVPY